MGIGDEKRGNKRKEPPWLGKVGEAAAAATVTLPDPAQQDGQARG
jgi:hypothetical protein